MSEDIGTQFLRFEGLTATVNAVLRSLDENVLRL